MNRNSSEKAFRFGPFELNLGAGQLLRDGRELKLRPKAYELLRFLVENHGRLMSKEELLDRIWQGRFVSEDSLTHALADVRRALGDEASLIATVAKRGYRFDGRVSGAGAGPQGHAAPDDLPATHYALSGELRIAYQVLGNGPIDLVLVPGWVTHLEFGWEEPSLAGFYRRLAAVSRLILFDKRCTGMSDRASGLPTIEQRMDDVRAVMDAVGSRRAALFAMSEGGGMAMTFAATYPERTAALMLLSVFAKREWSDDYPWAPTPAERQNFYTAIERDWGGPIGIEDIAPSRTRDPSFCAWWATYQRRSASPAAALALAHMNTAIDVRDALPRIKAPTLVMHRTNDRDANVEEGRFIARRIPGARFVELPGDDHLFFAGNQEDVLGPVEKFLAGISAAAASAPAAFRSFDRASRPRRR